MLRRLVPVPIKLVLILVGNDVHIASMEFLECFSYSRLLIINNRRSPAKHVRPSDTAENTAEPAQQTLKQYIFYLLRYCVFCTPHVRNVGIPPKFYLPGICLGGSQSAVAARFLGVVPYGVGLSSQIEVRKLVLNPEFEKVKGPWLFTSQRPFW